MVALLGDTEGDRSKRNLDSWHYITTIAGAGILEMSKYHCTTEPHTDAHINYISSIGSTVQILNNILT